jgi:hypothetical protein
MTKHKCFLIKGSDFTEPPTETTHTSSTMVPKTTIEQDISTKVPVANNLVCDFDDYSVVNSNICGGVEYTDSIGASQLSGLQIDNLPSINSISITDFTSISMIHFGYLKV